MSTPQRSYEELVRVEVGPLYPVQLREVRVESISAERYKDVDTTVGEIRLENERTTEKVSDTEARVTMKISVSFPAEGPHLFKVDVTGLGIYVCQDPGFKKMDEFIEAQGAYFVWTYLRVVISNVVQMLGLPSLVLPLVAVGGTPQSEAAATSE